MRKRLRGGGDEPELCSSAGGLGEISTQGSWVLERGKERYQRNIRFVLEIAG